jgi:hypothetical protein
MDAAAIAVEIALKVLILGVAEGGGSCIKISGTSKGVESKQSTRLFLSLFCHPLKLLQLRRRSRTKDKKVKNECHE